MHREVAPPPAAAGGHRRRSLRRRLLFVVLLLGALWLLVELVAFGAHWILRGEVFSYARVHAAQAARARAAAAAQPAAPASAFQDSGGDTCIHPYLGFVANRDTDDQILLAPRGYGVTDLGFIDTQGPVRRRDPRQVLVGIFGGSVAEFFGAEGADELATRLRAHPAFAGKRIEFVRLGLGGFKQPQQLLALTYLLSLGGELDLAINLDGFNEATLGPLENVPRNVPAFFPRNWSLLAEHAPDPTQRRLIGTVTVLQNAQRAWAQGFAGGPWRWSVAANLLWDAVDRWLDHAAGARLLLLQQSTRDDLPFHITGPGADRQAGDDALADESAATWARCSHAMQRMGAAHGIRYFHFLQPNQYFTGSKQLSADELRVAFDTGSRYRPWVERTFPRLREAGKQLAAEGVAFDDLTQLFAAETDTVYIDDCCHFNAAGNRRIGQAIAAMVLRTATADAAPARGAVRALRVVPATPRLERPLARLELTVFGAREGGGEDDVTYAEVAYASSDPEIVTVDRYGTLTALGDGDARVTVTLAQLRVEVPVAVRLPRVVDLGGAFAPRPLRRPVLHAVDVAGKVTLRLTPPGQDLPGAVCFAVTPAPRALCGGTVVVPLQSPHVESVGASAGELSVEVAAPDPRRRTVYVQAVYRVSDDVCGFAVSNALAITR